MTISRKAKERQAGIWKLREEQRGKKYYCCTEYGGKHGAKYVNEDILTEEFVANPKEPFDSYEMNRLYDLAYKMAKSGYPWQKFPTGYHD